LVDCTSNYVVTEGEGASVINVKHLLKGKFTRKNAYFIYF